MPVDIHGFPDPPLGSAVSVQCQADQLVISDGSLDSHQADRTKSQLELATNFLTFFRGGVKGMMAFGILFMVFWFVLVLKIGANPRIMLMLVAFGVFFAILFQGVGMFMLRVSNSGVLGGLAKAAPAWELVLNRDTWEVSAWDGKRYRTRTYDAEALSNVRYEDDYVIASEFDYDTGQWEPVELAGPLSPTDGQWLAKAFS